MDIAVFHITHSTVKLEVLAASGQTVAWASGFLVEEHDFLSLYTCWHVVTGADPHNLPSGSVVRRKGLRVHAMAREERPGIISIGGLQNFQIDLYDDSGRPTWFQGPAQEKDKDQTGLTPPPFWDGVRFNVDPYRTSLPDRLTDSDCPNISLGVGEDAFIVGFPYGYSGNEKGPDPIFLRRAVASAWGPSGFQLLDGPGAEGMSGGPIVTRIEKRWYVAGLYNGVVFPEAPLFLDRIKANSGRSTLPLAKYTMATIIRSVCGAKPSYKGVTE
jgi:hypothetical protein